MIRAVDRTSCEWPNPFLILMNAECLERAHQMAKHNDKSVAELEALLLDTRTTEARLALADQLSKMLSAKPGAEVVKRPKVIRDSFTLPEDDYKLILHMQDRALDVRMSVTKGEVLRAGLHALERMSNEELLSTLRTVEKLKPGRRKDEP